MCVHRTSLVILPVGGELVVTDGGPREILDRWRRVDYW